MDSFVLLKDQIWFLQVCHHVSNVLYHGTMWHRTSWITAHIKQGIVEQPNALHSGATKHGGRVHESGIEVLLTIRHIMLHTVRIQFFRAHELVHTFDGNSCLQKLHCMYILIHVTKCIIKQQLSKNSFSLAFESDHTRSTLHQHPTS